MPTTAAVDAAAVLREFDARVRASDWTAAAEAHGRLVRALAELARTLGADAQDDPEMVRLRRRYRALDAIVRAEHELASGRLEGWLRAREAWLAYERIDGLW